MVAHSRDCISAISLIKNNIHNFYVIKTELYIDSVFFMPRILAVDYGRKRCGIAVTDPLKIVANSLPVVRTCDLLSFLLDYCSKEQVERILVGEPRQMNGLPSESMKYIEPFLRQLKKSLPQMPVDLVDERFTSVIAHRDMITAGFKKSYRQRKGLADEMAAVIILNSYLESKKFNF